MKSNWIRRRKDIGSITCKKCGLSFREPYNAKYKYCPFCGTSEF